MRILTGILAIALLAAWGPVAPAAAQGTTEAKPAKTKTITKMAAKKSKKPAKEMYMRSAS
jgi:hypothetical protein